MSSYLVDTWIFQKYFYINFSTGLIFNSSWTVHLMELQGFWVDYSEIEKKITSCLIKGMTQFRG